MDLKKSVKPTRQAFSERMVEEAAVNRDFAVFDSDIGYSTYTCLFGDQYPERYFNLGIAEIGTMSAAAGMAASGRTVVVGGYGVFLTMRAVEAVRSFICYPNLNVKILSSHGGLTAAIDGATHQATEDIAYMTTLPNMKVLCPADPVSAAGCFDTAMSTPGPVFTRLMRDPLFDLYRAGEEFPIGGSKTLRRGSDITIVSYGDIVFQALEASEILAARGIDAEVIDMYSIKPFDSGALDRSLAKTGALLVAENHQSRNGLGYELARHVLVTRPVLFDNAGLEDVFGESGDYLRVIDKYGLSAARLADRARGLLEKK
jgi:transketolase